MSNRGVNMLEYSALSDAAKHSDGLTLSYPKTAAKLARRGYFMKIAHPAFGPGYQITDAGARALANAKG